MKTKTVGININKLATKRIDETAATRKCLTLGVPDDSRNHGHPIVLHISAVIFLRIDCFIYLHTEKSFLNLVKSKQTSIVITFLRQI